MNSNISINIARFIVLALVQILICSHINFLNNINPYLYILFIILYPSINQRELFIISSFFLGLTIDLFSDTGGIHAAASVFAAYLRPSILRFSFGVVYDNYAIKFSQADLNQKLVYFSLITLSHHIVLFCLEIFSISKIILIAQKIFFSTIFTILLCLLITSIFSKKRK